MKTRRNTMVLGLVVGLAAALGALAQDYSIDWYTVDGGGEMWSSGGPYELSGTIGQPDAGEMTGGTFTLTGGFWPGISCTPACTCGDIDESGGPVDLGDFGLFALCYGYSAPTGDCTGEYFACSDMDGSGLVDLQDFGLFALWYGQVPTQTVPECVPE